MRSLTRIIVISIIGLAASFLLVIFLISPTLSQLAKTNEEIRQRKSELALLEQQVRAYKNAQSDLSKASRKTEILEAFASEENLVLAVKELEAAAAQSQTTEILDIRDPVEWAGANSRVKPPAQVVSNLQGLTEIPYEVSTLSLDFKSLVDFVGYLEHLPHFMEISNINLSAEVKEGEGAGSKPIHTGKVMGNFKGVFFIQSAKK